MPEARSAPGKPGLEVEDLSKSYGSLRALKEASFALSRGTRCCLFGPNGSGKSTFLQLAAGVLAPDSGTLRFGGHDLSRSALAHRRRVVFLPQGLGLYEKLPLTSHLRLDWKLRGLEVRAREGGARRLLESFGLLEHAGTPVGRLSGGLRQAIAFCRAVLADPTLLLLDEPTAGLDATRHERVWSELRRLAAQGASIVVTSHILSDILECETLVVLHEGKVAKVTGVQDLANAVPRCKKAVVPRVPPDIDLRRALANPLVKRVAVQAGDAILWVEPTADLAVLRAEIRARGLPVDGLSFQDMSLEDRIRLLVDPEPE